MEKNKAYIYQNPAEFDRAIRRTIPYYEEMLEAIADSVFLPPHRCRGLDIGAGTGAVTKVLLKRHDHLSMHCLDFSTEMLGILSDNLAEFVGRYEITTHDIRVEPLLGSYDLVVSNLSVHHVKGLDGKRAFFENIWSCLSSGGQFIMGDWFLGANPDLDGMYETRWKEFEILNGKEPDDVENHHREMKKVDFPSPLVSQIQILQQIGFQDVDCVFKKYNFGVVACRR